MGSFKPPKLSITRNGGRYYEDWRVKEDGKSKQVFHHRLLAVAMVGFDNVAGNEIHHENGIPWDNRPSNLTVVTSHEHQRIEWGKDWPEDWRDEETLRDLYEDHTLQEISDHYDCSIRTIHYWFEKFGIERRKRGRAPPG
jgi:hypothetical protein